MPNLQTFDKRVLTMTSRDIAELVESRHDDTKRSIERLAERGVIELPPLAEIPTATKPVQVYVFSGEQGKRDSIVVVAQLSPEFTARDTRWRFAEVPARGTRFVALRKNGLGAVVFFRTPLGAVVDSDGFRMSAGTSDDDFQLWFVAMGFAFWLPLPDGMQLFFEGVQS